jgi:lipopolysaccharide/colanic/teichoic acid biosynthesis glycosyltransferase/glycosyltransferase involved in cell wall biosynthesis
VRVLHVGKFYPPVRGGMETILQTLCEAGGAGVRSRVLVSNTRARTEREHGGVEVTRVASVGRVGTVGVCPTLPLWMRRLAADVVVLHEPNPMGFWAYLLARPRGRLVVWLHSELVLDRWYYRVYRPFLRAALRRADRVVVSSPPLRDRVAGAGGAGDRTVVIPYGIDTERLRPTAETHARAAAIRARYRGPLVLFVGRLVAYKGVDVLLRALPPSAGTLIVAGNGPLGAALRTMVETLGLRDRVVFLGAVDDGELAALYHACDVFALPSTGPNEAFGLVQLEAMACGKPVVSTDLPSGVPWVNQHGQTGLIVPPGDADALRDALDALLGDALLRRKLGEAGRRRVEREFTRAALAARLTAFYRALPAPSPRGALAKRAFDVALSALGLLASSPIWLAVAVAVKLDDGGPVFYRQPRTGIGGRAFTGWKFRSMVADADARFGPRQAAAGDARVTRVGRWLRATALDELPQLWNILRGDMSFVGPRALMPEEIAVDGAGQRTRLADVPGYAARHAVTPGLTGVAQVYADRDIPARQKFRYDLLYIRRRSFGLDLRLIALSFWISFRGRWERRGPKV